MMESTEDTIYRGNTIIGASAYMIILGWNNTLNTTFEHNTMLAGGWGMVNHAADGYTYRDNIVVMAPPVRNWTQAQPSTTLICLERLQQQTWRCCAGCWATRSPRMA
ncbi:MAG: hypothetical protein GWP05_06665 [Anaerolineaceae bacterium]|nr:hypothetical protein [Anaerolineaceae bacterium]